jgi:hypothetical protein
MFVDGPLFLQSDGYKYIKQYHPEIADYYEKYAKGYTYNELLHLKISTINSIQKDIYKISCRDLVVSTDHQKKLCEDSWTKQIHCGTKFRLVHASVRLPASAVHYKFFKRCSLFLFWIEWHVDHIKIGFQCNYKLQNDRWYFQFESILKKLIHRYLPSNIELESIYIHFEMPHYAAKTSANSANYARFNIGNFLIYPMLNRTYCIEIPMRRMRYIG